MIARWCIETSERRKEIMKKGRGREINRLTSKEKKRKGKEIEREMEGVSETLSACVTFVHATCSHLFSLLRSTLLLPFLPCLSLLFNPCIFSPALFQLLLSSLFPLLPSLNNSL
jgi:hypothetical protein